MNQQISAKAFFGITIGAVLYFADIYVAIFGGSIGYPIISAIGTAIFGLYICGFGLVTIVTLIINSKNAIDKRRGLTVTSSDNGRSYLTKVLKLNYLTIAISAVMICTMGIIFWGNLDYGVSIVAIWLWAVIMLMCRMKIIEYKEELS